MSTVHFYCVLCGTALQTSSNAQSDLVECHSCTRHVPVPRPANGPGNITTYPSVFPAEVLELLVKFRCTACNAVLYADARYEGRAVVCSSCGAHPEIPRWSTVPDWSRLSADSPPARTPGTRSPARAEVPTLSIEEIDFLRGTESRKPEAAA